MINMSCIKPALSFCVKMTRQILMFDQIIFGQSNNLLISKNSALKPNNSKIVNVNMLSVQLNRKDKILQYLLKDNIISYSSDSLRKRLSGLKAFKGLGPGLAEDIKQVSSDLGHVHVYCCVLGRLLS